jgi:hypothetical protein
LNRSISVLIVARLSVFCSWVLKGVAADYI